MYDLPTCIVVHFVILSGSVSGQYKFPATMSLRASRDSCSTKVDLPLLFLSKFAMSMKFLIVWSLSFAAVILNLVKDCNFSG